jgi:hypothetical protein
VGALADADVANYLNQHFVSSFQKVGNFRIVNGQKQGGNVASYFTLPDGRVLHIVAGPVDAATLLREARWVVETRKLAVMTSERNAAKYQASWQKAHIERLLAEHGVHECSKGNGHHGQLTQARMNALMHHRAGLPLQAQVHSLLANSPLAPIDKIYREVFETILKQQTSNLPVKG